MVRSDAEPRHNDWYLYCMVPDPWHTRDEEHKTPCMDSTRAAVTWLLNSPCHEPRAMLVECGNKGATSVFPLEC